MFEYSINWFDIATDNLLTIIMGNIVANRKARYY
jgi:hypothetical protein